MMPIDHIADWERRLARQDAFWQCGVLDRPVVVMSAPKPGPAHLWPKPKSYDSHRERWMDTERVVASAVATVRNSAYFGDALPVAWPNLGPELFSAFFGMEMEYSPDSSWGIPNLTDWSQADQLALDKGNFYWKKLIEMTEALLAAGQGAYYVGITDMHPGGDALAAFRDPMQLNLDLLDALDDVKRLLARVNQAYFEAFDFYYDKLATAGQAITSWPGIVSTKKWYVPSNDFSCMVSAEMFDDVFLPGIIEECRHMEASIYHLDGPGALRHLDSLLEIPELNAIQWIYGAGNGRASDWFHVYQRCQHAGKGIQLWAGMDELDDIVAHLRPEGVWLGVNVSGADEAGAVLKKVSAWV